METSAELTVPKVSIIIPVYNRDRYLGLAVRSVLDQTFTDFELIIVDDGSTDGSLEIAQQFARDDDRVRVLSEPVNKGAAYALKKGFAAARGKYLGQVDSDDVLKARAVEITAAVLDDDIGCGLVFTNYLDIDENGKKLRPGWRCSYEPYSKEKLLTVFMSFHFRLFRQSVYEQVGGIDVNFNKLEDYELCLRMSEITQFIKIPEFLYLYRNHPNSVHNENRLDVVLLTERAINEALERRGMDTTHRVEVKFSPQWSIKPI